MTPGEGATVGLLAGLFGGSIESVGLAIMMRARGPIPMKPHWQQLPPEVQRIVEQILNSPMLVVLLVAIALITSAIFGTLGGLLGAAILGKREQRDRGG